MKIKSMGQVFTPEKIVNDILDIAEYNGEGILNKHVMENSCGDGAFLISIVERYIKEYKNKNGSLKLIEKSLEKYIHGIELDKEVYDICINNLNKVVKEHKLGNIKWDIINENTLLVEKYNGKMDFVIGNPPYVRVHNLEEQYEYVKKYKFCDRGMTDLYIVFFEIGLKMLNKNGILSYITPNSFYNSVAGKVFRNYIQNEKNLEVLMDLGHYQPFSVMTYTTITKFKNNNKFDSLKYYKYDLQTGMPKYVTNIDYDKLFINGNIVLFNGIEEKYKKILEFPIKDKKTQVKNAFATLNDKVFISDEFNFDGNVIDVIKASTGEWKKCIYPYDKNGNIISFDRLNNSVKEYLTYNRELLENRSLDSKSKWYGFGRTQAINDVWKNKICINTTIKDIDSIKLCNVEMGKGIYSGLYIITDATYEEIEKIIKTEEFIEYVKILNKCKSGGYYTFSSQDLSRYINYKLEGLGDG